MSAQPILLKQCASGECDPSLTVTSKLPWRWAILMAPGTFRVPVPLFSVVQHTYLFSAGGSRNGLPIKPRNKKKFKNLKNFLKKIKNITEAIHSPQQTQHFIINKSLTSKENC